ncbi:MAG TPA: tRNA lysidine(34) synthetase TilS [Eubacterium sp.]|nr:tRNA lysidine(34) synthetase TilS [Eubacterium sp.]
MKLSKFEYNIYNFIRENKLLENTKHIVVGVSGGADSICLISVLKRISEYVSSKSVDDSSFDLMAVHINHNIRGKEAKRDETFVVDFCEKNGIPLIVESLDVVGYSNKNNLSLEEAGRVLRYEAFARAASKWEDRQFVKIAVAHNENDNVETVIFNIIRGSGLKGVSGIPVKRDDIIRPLLSTTRESIEDYLKSRGIDYVVDSTNLQEDYSRNKIRLMVLPYLQNNFNQNVFNAISNLAEIATEANEFIENQVDKAYKKYVSEYEISSQILDEDECVISGVIRKCFEDKSGKLKDITKTHVNNIMNLFGSIVSSSIELPYGIIAKRTYNGVEFAIKSENQQINVHKEYPSYQIKKSEEKQVIEGAGFRITVEVKPADVIDEKIIKNKENQYTKYIDYDKIDSDLYVRSRQKGDYIVVNSEGGHKKIKDYFSDMKIPREERDDILLLSSDDKILWVIGYRIGEDIKVTSDTNKILKISYEADKE